MDDKFDHVALIGLGLIGSSLSLAMRRAGIAGKITGHARSAQTREKALTMGLVDAVFDNAADAVRGADLIILCVPIGVYGAIAQDIAPVLKPGSIVTDVGSVKAAVIRDTAPHIPTGVYFVPAHPIAGSERSGPEAGFTELFDGRWCILTPIPGTDEEALGKIRKFWENCGMSVDTMTPEHHDLVLAITSHLPHLIAYNIVGTAADLEAVTESEVIKFSAGGFRDSTRLAASDPTMWRDVFLNNKEAVLEMLARFSEDLTALQRAIRWGEGETLFNLFTRTRKIRTNIIDAGQDTDAPDFGRPHGDSGPEGKETR